MECMVMTELSNIKSTNNTPYHRQYTNMPQTTMLLTESDMLTVHVHDVYMKTNKW